MKEIISTGVLILASFYASAQGLESELGFIYVKAEYLLETNRYEEAISECNKIIESNPGYKDVLLLKAEAKYALAAYKGVRKDILEYIGIKGLNARSIKLLGLAEFKLNDYDAASQTLGIHYAVDDKDVEAMLALSEAYLALEEEDKACEVISAAVDLGSSRALVQSRKYCSQYISRSKEAEARKTGKSSPVTKDARTDLPARTDTLHSGYHPEVPENDAMDTATADDIDPKKDPGDPEDIQIQEEDDFFIDDSVNEIYVDEDLTLFIKNGLGGRGLLQQPNILILSENSGHVAVDICVNSRGKVISADFNPNDSSINTPSLVSLAVRKSNDFWFKRSSAADMCGTIVFQITGRS